MPEDCSTVYLPVGSVWHRTKEAECEADDLRQREVGEQRVRGQSQIQGSGTGVGRGGGGGRRYRLRGQ